MKSQDIFEIFNTKKMGQVLQVSVEMYLWSAVELR